jgi:hypothetical protein
MTAQTLTNKIALALTGGVTALLTNVAVLGGESDGAPLRWAFEAVQGGIAADVSGRYRGKAEGPVQLAPGAEGQALVFDGASALVAVPAAPAFSIGAGPFTVAAWVCPYLVGDGQRIIAAKNDYAANRREWGLMIDKDGLFRFYTHAGGWQTLASKTKPEPGRWRHVAAVFEKGGGRLYVDGQLEGEGPLADTVPATAAPLTFGGVLSGGSSTQLFRGALDEAVLCRAALPADAVARLAAKTPEPHPVPEIAKPVALWSGGALPKTADAPVLKDVAFHVVKPYEPDRDSYRFLHGVALAWHKGKLYASFGHNRGGENTDTEEARVRISADGGATWGPVTTIDPGDEPGVGVSHGVFLSHGGRLWAFHGAYQGIMQGVHTRAYVLNETDGTWERKGTVVEGGFWPLQEPLKMADGNWIMSGIRVGGGDPAAVAVSRGDDFTKWDLAVIPRAAGVKMWGESAVFLDGRRVVNVARCDGRQPVALVAVSEDCGRTWSESRPSDLPMAASKPYAGTLGDGRHYLICSTAADGSNRRSPLTIALSRPGESTLSRLFVIRHALFPDGPGESHPKAGLAYPYAVERDGKLYVGYSNSGGGAGRTGEGRELWNNNSAELAVIPLEALK